MRYLILSDIHSNLTALNTVVDAVNGRWEKTVCAQAWSAMVRS